MTDQGKPDRTYNDCVSPGEHREHLCTLMDRGQTAEVRQRTTHPAFRCRNCAAVANLREDLCNPAPL